MFWVFIYTNTHTIYIYTYICTYTYMCMFWGTLSCGCGDGCFGGSWTIFFLPLFILRLACDLRRRIHLEVVRASWVYRKRRQMFCQDPGGRGRDVFLHGVRHSTVLRMRRGCTTPAFPSYPPEKMEKREIIRVRGR